MKMIITKTIYYPVLSSALHTGARMRQFCDNL